MSKIVDERVVSMQFDNKHFESNVSTTMSTLDKLKQKLNLSGASKGLENVNAAAKNVNLSPIGSAAETVGLKFNAMYTMADQALRNITNSAMAAGKRIASALTIDPIKTGFSEYETQINAVQTILANTESKGTTLDQVNTALEELNKYADKTIYNFTEMTRNIGTFTAAGVDLDTSVNAIQGIANLAAVSGSTSQQASTAMYQLSQALSSGTVKLMDWNSVVNAGMGGQVFQDALKETARVHGIAIDSMIEEQGSFRETLSEGWLSSEILTETLMKFTMATEGATEAEIKANKEKLKGLGYTDEQIEGIFKLGNTATNAATKVKTFTQLWDVMKEAAQSGWAQTWKLIIGDFEEAKALFTPLSDFFTGIINKVSEARNAVLESALGQNFIGLGKKIKEIFDAVSKPIDKVTGAIDGVTRTLEEHNLVVDEVIGGKWGVMQERWDALTEAGYDWVYVQNKVNEKLGVSLRRSTDYTGAVEDQTETQEKLNVSQAERIEQLTKMSDAELKALGLTNDQIEALRDLQKVADQLGLSVGFLVENIDDINGRWILLNSFKNIGKGLIDTFNAMKTAWQEVFPPKSTEEKAKSLFNLIGAFHKFTTAFTRLTNEEGEFTDTGKKLVRTFEGIFAAVDIVATILGGGFKIAFKAVRALLKYFNLDILDVTARIADVIIGFRDWIDSVLDFEAVFERIIPPIQNAIKSVKEWIASLKDSKNLPKDIARGIANGFGAALTFVKNILANLFGYLTGGFESVPGDMVAGFVNGIWNGVKLVGQVLMELGKIILEKICDVLGIHSPSTEFYEIAMNCIQGLINGFKAFAGGLWDILKGIGSGMVDIFKEIDIGQIIAVALGAGLLFAVNKIANIVGMFASPLEGLGDMFEGIGSMVTDIGKGMKNYLNSKALFSLALSLVAMAGALAILANIPKDRLWASVGALGALVGILAVLGGVVIGLNALSSKIKGSFGIKETLVLVAIAGAILLLAVAVGKLANVDADNLGSALKTLAILAGALSVLVISLSALVKTSDGLNQVGSMLIKMSVAMLLMIGVIKLAAGLDDGQVKRGLGVVLALELLFAAIIWVAKSTGQFTSKAGGMLLKMSFAFMAMIGVVKLAAGLDRGEVKRGLSVVLMLGVLFSALIAVSRLAGENSGKAGGMLLGMSMALLIAIGAMKIAATMDPAEVKQGLAAVAVLELLFMGLIAISKQVGKHAAQVGSMLLLMSGALLILTGVVFLLGQFDPKELAQGLIAVTILSGIFAGLIAVTKIAKSEKGMVGVLVTLIVAITLLVGAVVALTLIDPAKLTMATEILAGITGMFAALIYATKYLQSGEKTWWRSLVTIGVLTVVVGLLGGLIWLITNVLKVDGESAAKNAAALSTMLVAMSGALFVLSKVKGNWKAVGTNIALLTAMVVPLAAFALAISWIPDVTGAINNIVTLTAVMAAMTVLLIPLTLLGYGAPGAAGGIVALTAMVIPLIAFAWAINWIPDVTGAINNVVLLTGLMTAMTVLLIPLTLIGFLAIGALAGIGALTKMVIPLTVFALALAILPDVTDATGNVVLLTGLLTVLTDVLVRLAPIAPLALIGVAAITALGLVITAFGRLATSVGALMTLFPFLEDFLDRGIVVLEKMAVGLGSVIGKFITAFAGEVMTLLPQLGTCLSTFMSNAMPFIDGAKMVDDNVLKGVGILAGAILALTAADIITGITSWMSGGSSFAELGTELSQFMTNAAPFIEGAKNLDPTIAESVRALAETILVLTAADVLEGLTSWFTGGSSLSAFGAELAQFGPHLATFAQSVAGLTPEALNAMKVSAEAGRVLAEMAATFPNTGGWLGKILGENNADTFGAQLKGFGAGLMSYGRSVNGIEEYIDSINQSVEAGKSLTKLADAIPNSSGFLAAFLGDNTMDAFGAQLASFGRSLMSYGRSVNGIGDYTDSISASVEAATGLSELAKKIPNSAGFLAAFLGDNTMDTFGTQLASFGRSLMSYGRSVNGIGDYVGAIRDSVSAANNLVGVANAAKQIGKWDIGKSEFVKFGENIASFGKQMSNYSKNISGISVGQLSSATSAFVKIADLARGIQGVNFSGMSSLANSLGKIGKDSVNKFIEAFTNADTKVSTAANKLATDIVKALDKHHTKFNTEGKNVAKEIADGLTKGKGEVNTSLSSVLSSAVTTIRSKRSSFYNAGAYLVDGFAAGISANAYKAAAKAKAMAQAAERAAKAQLDEHSPSRVGYEIGDYFGVGFINGIADNITGACSSSAEMAAYAKEGLTNAIRSISDIINGDIDTNPVIRPVLDLTNIKSGADSIGNLLGLGSSVGVLSGINATIDSNRQNGVNDDVITAINELRKDLGNIGNTSYTINGVTYDDGSNITEAVRTIVRAAIVERRV